MTICRPLICEYQMTCAHHKFHPWLECILSGTPNWQIQLLTRTLTQVEAHWFDIAYTLAHFVKLHCTVRIKRFPLLVCGGGPTMSMCSRCIGYPALGFLRGLLLAQVRQSLQYSLTVLEKFGYQKRVFIFWRVFLYPWWPPSKPSWHSLSVGWTRLASKTT